MTRLEEVRLPVIGSEKTRWRVVFVAGRRPWNPEKNRGDGDGERESVEGRPRGLKNRFSKEHGDHRAARQKRNGVYPLVKEASVVCYERENRFYDTN